MFIYYADDVHGMWHHTYDISWNPAVYATNGNGDWDGYGHGHGNANIHLTISLAVSI